MVSCLLISHRSQAMQTSRFSMARVLMNTCGMWYIERFWNVVCSCNFVICTHTYALGMRFKLLQQYITKEVDAQTKKMQTPSYFRVLYYKYNKGGRCTHTKFPCKIPRLLEPFNTT